MSPSPSTRSAELQAQLADCVRRDIVPAEAAWQADQRQALGGESLYRAPALCAFKQARLLTRRAANNLGREGYKAARDHVAVAESVLRGTATRVIDLAIQAQLLALDKHLHKSYSASERSPA